MKFQKAFAASEITFHGWTGFRHRGTVQFILDLFSRILLWLLDDLGNEFIVVFLLCPLFPGGGCELLEDDVPVIDLGIEFAIWDLWAMWWNNYGSLFQEGWRSCRQPPLECDLSTGSCFCSVGTPSPSFCRGFLAGSFSFSQGVLWINIYYAPIQ